MLSAGSRSLKRSSPSVHIMINSLALHPQVPSAPRSLQLRPDLHISGQLCNPDYHRATGRSTCGTIAYPRRTTFWTSRFSNEAGLAWCASSVSLPEIVPSGLNSTPGSTPGCWQAATKCLRAEYAALSEWPLPLPGLTRPSCTPYSMPVCLLHWQQGWPDVYQAGPTETCSVCACKPRPGADLESGSADSNRHMEPTEIDDEVSDRGERCDLQPA